MWRRCDGWDGMGWIMCMYLQRRLLWECIVVYVGLRWNVRCGDVVMDGMGWDGMDGVYVSTTETFVGMYSGVCGITVECQMWRCCDGQRVTVTVSE